MTTLTASQQKAQKDRLGLAASYLDEEAESLASMPSDIQFIYRREGKPAARDHVFALHNVPRSTSPMGFNRITKEFAKLPIGEVSLMPYLKYVCKGDAEHPSCYVEIILEELCDLEEIKDASGNKKYRVKGEKPGGRLVIDADNFIIPKTETGIFAFMMNHPFNEALRGTDQEWKMMDESHPANKTFVKARRFIHIDTELQNKAALEYDVELAKAIMKINGWEKNTLVQVADSLLGDYEVQQNALVIHGAAQLGINTLRRNLIAIAKKWPAKINKALTKSNSAFDIANADSRMTIDDVRAIIGHAYMNHVITQNNTSQYFSWGQIACEQHGRDAKDVFFSWKGKPESDKRVPAEMLADNLYNLYANGTNDALVEIYNLTVAAKGVINTLNIPEPAGNTAVKYRAWAEMELKNYNF